MCLCNFLTIKVLSVINDLDVMHGETTLVANAPLGLVVGTLVRLKIATRLACRPNILKTLKKLQRKQNGSDVTDRIESIKPT